MECLNAPYGKLNPIKGSNCQGVWSRRQLTNVSDLDLYLFNDHAIKMTMMSYWRDKTITLPTQATYDKEFIKGLSGQTLIRDKKTGKYSFKSLKADHYHDAVKACVLSSIIEHITPGIVEGEVESEQEG